MAIDRGACVKKYLALQDRARELMPHAKTPHITKDMSDDEIVRLGKWLKKLVESLEKIKGDQ